MTVWHFNTTQRDRTLLADLYATQTKLCPCCAVALDVLPGEHHSENIERSSTGEPRWSATEDTRGYGCARCGWWYVLRTNTYDTHGGTDYGTSHSAAGAVMLRFDEPELAEPVARARQELVADFAKAKAAIHPSRFEEVVASVFGDMGYQTRVSGRSHDGGVDVVLDGGERTIWVQVKRYRDTVGVHLVRELVGALVAPGLTDGVVVTTSDFSREARAYAGAVRPAGYVIELVNGNQFFSALRIAQLRRLPYREELLAGLPYGAFHEVFRQDGVYCL